MSWRSSGLKVTFSVLGLSTFLFTGLASATMAPEPQLRIKAAEVYCEAPMQLILHGDFGEVLDSLSLVLDLPTGPVGLWIKDASPERIIADLPSCDPPGTYRLTVGYGSDSANKPDKGDKTRPPQFYTVLDLALGAAGPRGERGPQGADGPPGLAGLPGMSGADGDDGAPGANGLDGLACWDLDESRTCEALELGNEGNEDLNGDGVCTPADCTGPRGEQGPQGLQGLPGPAGSLALAGQFCPPPDSIIGFDANGEIICSSERSAEVCDGLDNNFDGVADEGLLYCNGGAPAPNTDGAACSPGFFDLNDDPADGCEATPMAEVCDGLDNDNDGSADEGLLYCFAGTPAANTNGASCNTGFFDANGDAADGCESATPPVEICGDGIDNDFDGQTDEGCTAPLSPITACRLVFPSSITGAPGDNNAVFGRFLIPGLTDQTAANDISPNVEGELGYGVSNDASTWTWTAADYNPGYVAPGDSDQTSDEMQGSLIISVAGTFNYGFRFRVFDSTASAFGPYVYCDGAGIVSGTTSDNYGSAFLFGDPPQSCAALAGTGLDAELTCLHNEVRAAAEPTPVPPLDALTWSNEVAAVAQSWADTCTLGHNPARGSLGENIFVSTGVVTPQAAVEAWASEAADYDYVANTCAGSSCGHYTQIVWRTTTSIGCAVADCPGGIGGFPSGQIMVCNYDPPGNFGGQRPY